MKRILILINSLGGLYNFRKELVEKLIERGYQVVISAPINEESSFFIDIGCRYIETPINRRGINPVTDFKLFIKYIDIIKTEKPDIVLTYTIKPNIYGGLACRLLKIPYIANITGLGTSIENKGLISKISLFLYKIGLKDAGCVFFQNQANSRFFINKNIVNNKIRLIPGSGVNLEQHKFEDYPESDDVIRFLFIGRIMKSKGVNELLEASEKIKSKYPNVEFHLVGGMEEDYTQKLNELESKGIIKYHGRQIDVHPFIKDSHAIINPSYHEGMSNVLLESASTGRPVLASDIPGCRETFDEGISGYKFNVKNVDSLIETIIKFIKLPYDEKKKMGVAGRLKMESEFDRNIVVNEYLDAIESILGEGARYESVREN